MSSKPNTPPTTIGKILTPPIPTPALPPPPKNTFTIHSKTHILASPKVVFKTILDTKTYPLWNPFCPAITITSQSSTSKDKNAKTDKLQLGSKFIEKMYMDGTGLLQPESARGKSRLQPCVVTCFEDDGSLSDLNDGEGGEKGKGKGKDEGKREGYRIAWIGTGFPGWVLRTERVLSFRDDGEGGCEYEDYETLGGVLAHFLKWFYGTWFVERFGDSGRGLKDFCEKDEDGRLRD